MEYSRNHNITCKSILFRLFLVTYTQAFYDNNSRTFSRRFDAVIKRRNEDFTLTGVGADWVQKRNKDCIES